VLLLLLLLIGLALRLIGLDARGLWLDEAISIKVATQSVSEIVSGGQFDRHTPPFYYLVLHFWLLVLPVSEISIRFLSVVFDVANIALIYWIFSRQYRPRIGLLTAAFYACSPFAIYYAQEGRMYPLVVLLALAVASVALACEGAAYHRLWVIPIAVAGLYTHYYFVLFLACISVYVIYRLWGSWQKMAVWVAAMVTAAICFLPWLGTVWSLAQAGGQGFRRFSISVLPYTFFRFIAGYAVMPLSIGAKESIVSTALANLHLLAPVTMVFAAILVVAVLTVRQRYRGDLVLYASLLVGLPVSALLLNLVAPMLSERYLIIVYPFFLGLLAMAPWGEGAISSSIRRRSWALLQIAALLLAGHALIRYYTSDGFGPPQIREAARYIVESGKEVDCVIVRPRCYAQVVRFYLPEEMRTIGVLVDSQRPVRLPCRRSFWLIEVAEQTSLAPAMASRGLTLAEEKLLPVGNGVKITLFLRREAPSSREGGRANDESAMQNSLRGSRER
jgi:uncharacterized membrane protein